MKMKMMNTIACRSFYVLEHYFHEKLAPSHLKNGGISQVPIRFEKKTAMEIARVLNISMAVSGSFQGALEMRNGGDIVVSEDMKKYTVDDMVAIDFQYFGVLECLD